MRIKHLSATGLKGSVVDIAPNNVSIITGPNWSGKTAYKDAFHLGLIGYHETGKAGQTIIDLADESGEIKIDVEFEDAAITRSWKQKGKSVEATKTVGIEIPPVLLDLDVLFSMTKAERQSYIFEKCHIETVTRDTVTAAIKNVKVAESSEESEAAIQTAVELAANSEGETIQEWIAAALKQFAERLKVKKAQAADLKAFARVNTILSDEDAPIRDAQAKVAKLRDEKEQAAVAFSEQMRAISEHGKNIAALASARAALAELNSDDMAAGFAALEQAVADAEKALQDSGVAEELAAAKAACISDEEYSSLEAEMNSYAEKQTAAHTTLKVNQSKLHKLQDLLAKCVGKIDAVERLECCPLCGADGSKDHDWKAKIMAGHTEERAVIKGEILETDEAIVTLESEYSSAKTFLQERSDALNAAREKQLDAVKCENQLSLLEKAVAAAQQRLFKAQQGAQAGIARTEALRLQIAQRTIEVDALDEAALRNEACRREAAVEAAQYALVAADIELRNEIAARDKLRQEHEAAQRYQATSAEVEVLKAAGQTIQQIQKEATAQAFEPLLNSVRLFTDGILEFDLAFHDGEIGYWRGGKFVKSTTFSGAQWSLYAAGLAVALAQESPCKIVIIDELSGKFRRSDTLPKVIERMRDLTKTGVLDHFVGICSDSEIYEQYAGEPDVLLHRVGM